MDTSGDEASRTGPVVLAARAESPVLPEADGQREEARHGPPGRLRLKTFSSLRYPNYRNLWFGTLCMSAGQWIQQVTLGWLVYELTGSAVLLGALNGLRSIPFLVASPLGGVLADRMDRRRLLLTTQPLLALSAFLMGGLVLAGLVEVWHLFAFTLGTGVVWSFNQPVRQSLVPNVVPRHEVANAVALSSLGFNLMKVVGPALAGVLIAWFGAGGNFLVQGAAFVAVLVAISLMEVPRTPDQARKHSALANLREGFSYVRTNRLVLMLLLVALVPQVMAMPYVALMPVFQKDVLQVGPEGLGLLMGAPGVGAMIGTLGLASFAHRVRQKGRVLLVTLCLLGLSLIAFSQMTTLPLSLLALVAVGGFHILFVSLTYTLVQLVVPDALRGRVMSLLFLDIGMRPIGDLLAGVSTHYVGAPVTVAGMGGLVLLMALALWWRAPHLRKLEL